MGEAIRRERPVVDAMGLAAGALAANA